MHKAPDPKSIPGMIEPIEQETLTNIARYINLADPESIVVEFGAFFGRSTASMICGLMQNTSLALKHRTLPVLHTYDSFSCAQEGGNFANYVQQLSRYGGLEHLLVGCDGVLDFKPVFDHFLATHEAAQNGCAPMLTSICTQLSNIPDCPGMVSMIHIDAPKHYNEMEPILEKYFPHLSPEGIIVFQDFFYHWSGSLIACIASMIRDNIIEPAYSAATALICEVRRVPTATDIENITQEMQVADISQLISLAYEQLGTVGLDRPEQFLSRLMLAQAQIKFESGRHAEARHTILKMLKKHPLNKHTLNDLLDLIGHGFSIRSGYNRDHAS